MFHLYCPLNPHAISHFPLTLTEIRSLEASPALKLMSIAAMLSSSALWVSSGCVLVDIAISAAIYIAYDTAQESRNAE